MRGKNRPHIIGKTNRDPLRKIVGNSIDAYGVMTEVLECGHEQRPREDIIGPTNAYRRRCSKCAKALVEG